MATPNGGNLQARTQVDAPLLSLIPPPYRSITYARFFGGGGRVMRPCLTFRPHYFLDRHGRAPLTVTLENLQAANLLRITSLLVRIIEGHHLVIQSMYLTY